jgi:hypothetical protein
LRGIQLLFPPVRVSDCLKTDSNFAKLTQLPKSRLRIYISKSQHPLRALCGRVGSHLLTPTSCQSVMHDRAGPTIELWLASTKRDERLGSGSGLLATLLDRIWPLNRDASICDRGLARASTKAVASLPDSQQFREGVIRRLLRLEGKRTQVSDQVSSPSQCLPRVRYRTSCLLYVRAEFGEDLSGLSRDSPEHLGRQPL